MRGPTVNPTDRAVQLFIEAQSRSNFLFLSNSGRKTASHFSWNCSSVSAAPRFPGQGRISNRP
ncbi:hypothetical protein ELG97_03575 [Rhizobium leguminosarum]|uniref:Uncharacterized protein n=1 Tax=Rhizobium leguminosarum TaxID=384 RepID=A0A7M3E325_RHILE|nr:hypothetical protein [Rhizobium leguminosarum bv. viciae]TAY55353.1 hypothetical protein ELH90_02795 [Rhizobium leguminosarum]TBE94921.1 hypothetical protein ELG97_03575 [Rhizobium leguminosarum]TBZ72176.1 hypothetical protein E0H64_07525 [Rhizobium leguminosarum bv. viciae]